MALACGGGLEFNSWVGQTEHIVAGNRHLLARFGDGRPTGIGLKNTRV